MFSFLSTEKSLADELFKQKNIKTTQTSMAVQAFNSSDDKIYGYCFFDFSGLTATIISLECSDEYHFLPECLIKSALNYAANRGAFIAECNNINLEKELINLGFTFDGEKYSSEIPKLMAGSCASCSQKNIKEIDKHI
ncbi:MAG: hypothetical protein RR343_01830 [Oscillospiraceae bacterium]